MTKKARNISLFILFAAILVVVAGYILTASDKDYSEYEPVVDNAEASVSDESFESDVYIDDSGDIVVTDYLNGMPEDPKFDYTDEELKEIENYYEENSAPNNIGAGYLDEYEKYN